MMSLPTCETCGFADFEPGRRRDLEHHETEGYCRENSPQFTDMEKGSWPRIFRDDSCGRHSDGVLQALLAHHAKQKKTDDT